MMHHAVAKRSGLDGALLGIGNDKLAVAAVFIRLKLQFPTQREQIFLQFITEFQNRTAVAFAFSCVFIGSVQIGKIKNFCKQVWYL
jgi:hypothetical protein